MSRTKCVALLAVFLVMSSAPARVQGTPQKGAAKTTRTQTAKAPVKTAAAKKAELARRKKEFEEMLVRQEKQAWEEEKKQNADFFREVMTDQFVAAEPDGKLYNKEEVLRLIPTVRMASYELTDFQVIRAGRDAAVLTYRVTVRETSEGNAASLLATTVWARRGKAWKMTFHQKTPAPSH